MLQLVIVGPDTTAETENILDTLSHGLEGALFLDLEWCTLMVLLINWRGKTAIA